MKNSWRCEKKIGSQSAETVGLTALLQPESSKERLKETKDVQKKVAEEFAASEYECFREMVRETDFVKPGDEVPNVVSRRNLKALPDLKIIGCWR